MEYVKDVIKETNSTRKRRYAEFICDKCGNHFIARYDTISSGKTVSCGCFQGKNQQGHGDSYTYLYKVWRSLQDRCKYNDYYTRKNISVYTLWIKNYPLFKKWILENLGEKPHPKMSLDRINNAGNYEPGNLRWATQKQQLDNRG